MIRTKPAIALLAALATLVPAVSMAHDSSKARDLAVDIHAVKQVREGRETFRYATFGDEDFWGDLLGLHLAIAGSANGGVGPGVSPKAALDLGLKVDVDNLPKSVIRALRADRVDLNNPRVTVDLLRANAVVGLTGFFNEQGKLSSIGIQCALCHSTVDDSLAPGIGHRRDGWAARDLNVGKIISIAPRLEPVAQLLGVSVQQVRDVLLSWGPGKFDAELFFDGKAFQPDGRSAATLIPPAFGLAGVNLHTWTGWGGISHWNALVANLEMHGKGTFYDPRLDDAEQFPIAARERFGHVRAEEDLITPLLGSLQLYQLALEAPQAPRGSYDRFAARRGEEVFNGKAQCATCHVPPLFTEPGFNMHTAEEIGIDAFQADRSPDRRYRTAPLRGLWTHTKGGFYHDGRFPTLASVITHYESALGFALSAAERRDLEHYLRSL